LIKSLPSSIKQLSIPKEQLEKIEYRPKQTGSRVVRETTTDNTLVNKDAARSSQGPSGLSSSNVTLGGKPGFQVVWIRPRGK
jgi:hypothetical protein